MTGERRHTVGRDSPAFKVMHLTTVDSSLRYLLRAQLAAVRDRGGEAVGISAPGPDNNLYVHLLAHFTINANGEATANVFNFTADCR